eukprot:PITA_30214
MMGLLSFAPIAQYSSIRTILAVAAQMGWKIHQVDVKTTFLNGVVEERHTNYGFWYKQVDGVRPAGFTDAEWAGSSTNRKSTSGGIFNIGSTIISWYNKKQRSVALGLTEAEYMAANQATCEAIWMRKLLMGILRQGMEPTMIHGDNQSCIKLSENAVFHDRLKHIEIRYHHLRDYV